MKKYNLFIIAILMILACTLPAEAAYLVFSQGNLPMVSQKINVKITNQIAVTSLEMVFYNPNDFTIQPNIRFPIHEKASVQNFSLTDSTGQTYAGTIEEAEQAQQTFDEAKAEGLMPAMAVQKQPGVFETSIGAVGPTSRATVVIEYSEILPYNKGKVSYRLPFKISDWQATTLETVSISAEIADQKEIVSLKSSSHDIYAEKTPENTWKMVYEKNAYLPTDDFAMDYEVKADAMAASFLSTRPDKAEDGYFVLMLSPQEIVAEQDIAERDIVFVMDTSGSMSGSKLPQTQKAFEFFVNKLNERDRFGIIAFSNRIVDWKTELMPVSDTNRSQAKDFINQLHASGGTNINDSLLAALKLFDDSPNRTRTLVFLTDGEASAGVTRTEQIVANFNAANTRQVRAFTLGVGRSVNTSLLNKIAVENRGEAVYLDERANNIDESLISFYQSISTPLLVDLELDWGNIKVTECYPKTLPNIYQGTQLVITGRYQNSGETQVTLTGNLNSSKQAFPVTATFADESKANLFVSRYWAKAKADDLLLQMQTYGQKPEMKEEVVRLSKKYQFTTPFTSFIAVSQTPVPQIQQQAANSPLRQTAAMAARINTTSVKKTIIRKTEAKPLSLWGATGFLPIAAIAVPNFRKAREQSREKACYANMRVLLGAIEMYNMDNHSMITTFTENEMSLLIDGKYLKSAVNRPTEQCHYGCIGDVSQNGMIVCAEHGTVEMPETAEAAIAHGNSIYYDPQTNSYVSMIIEEHQAVTPWTTRIWNTYLADIVNLLINVPLFIIGIAFTLWLTYTILSIPFKVVYSIIRFIFPANE